MGCTFYARRTGYRVSETAGHGPGEVDTTRGGVEFYTSSVEIPHMRISAKGEYAAKAVLYLSLKHPRVVTIHEVAKRHSIPVKYLEHILLALKKAGLLASRRGVRGGYALARPPEQISIGEVLRVVDGKFSQSSCIEVDLQSHYACPESDTCGLKQVWQDVQSAVEKILFQTTFDDLRKRTLAGAVRRRDYLVYEI